MVGFIQSDYRAAVNSINLGQPMVVSAPASKATVDLRQMAAKIFDGKVDQRTAATESKRSFNSIFRRQAPQIDEFGLTAALDRANLGEVAESAGARQSDSTRIH